MTPTTALIVLDVPEFRSLSVSKAEQIRNTFLPMAETLAGFEEAFADVTTRAAGGITKQVSADARRVRLDIAKIRVAAEKARVAIKAEYVLGSKAIDGANNILKWAIEGKEQALEAIENHAARLEAEQVERTRRERTEALAAFGVMVPEGLGTMDAEVWAAYLAARKIAWTERLEAERTAAAERAEMERRREIALQRTRAIATVADFVPADVLEDPTLLSDDDFAEVVASASAAKLARQLEAERLERERREVQLRAAHDAREEVRRLEAIRATEILEAAEAARVAQEAADAPVKARLRAWVASFELPKLPGESCRLEAAIRGQFAKFRAASELAVDRFVDVPLDIKTAERTTRAAEAHS